MMDEFIGVFFYPFMGYEMMDEFIGVFFIHLWGYEFLMDNG